jgi:ArsR family transcriptional regulator, arsenate/arsenite/antimonite-responsive transcriptional repressor
VPVLDSSISPLELTDARTPEPALVFKALGDTTRYAIASTIARTPMTSVELSRAFGVSKPTISHHVQQLRAAELLIERPTDNGIELTIDRRVLEEASSAAADEMFSDDGPDQTIRRTRKANRERS